MHRVPPPPPPKDRRESHTEQPQRFATVSLLRSFIPKPVSVAAEQMDPKAITGQTSSLSERKKTKNIQKPKTIQRRAHACRKLPRRESVKPLAE